MTNNYYPASCGHFAKDEPQNLCSDVSVTEVLSDLRKTGKARRPVNHEFGATPAGSVVMSS
jgi:hypothetical protein